ncbi:hypothetical protein [Rhodococcus sp. 105337]|uniref:hypothetical protein n=1 Tax=Rhodococcus sp. 105337 TaxID=2725310 RepID=UPI00146F8026|nr:hypothetical protein [Rhodococcus sp. 105337]NME80530.1 hypothetical protein [Rhodococcus sp. 105337]
MYTSGEAHFSWTSRRVMLPEDDRYGRSGVAPDTSGVTLDRVLMGSRLMACRDVEQEREYVALAVGAVDGGDDVPVRVVEEERLLLHGPRSGFGPEILVGAEDDDLDDREVTRQLLDGGPLRSLLTRTGAHSVALTCASAHC